MSDPEGPAGRRRGLLFTVAPVVMAILLVVGLATVIRASTRPHPVAGQAAPAADAEPLTTAPTTTTPATTPPPTSTATPTPAPDSAARLSAAVAAVDSLSTASTELGVAVLDRTTGTEELGEEGATQFYSASVVKLFVITALLHEQEAGEVSLSGTDDDQITRALELSDDNAMDDLWVDHNGPALVDEMIKLAGLHDTELPEDTSQWGETLLSARDVLAVYQYVFTGLNAADSQLVLTDLNNAGASGADGFDQSFGLLSPGSRTASTKAKQGWMIDGSDMMLHTTGVLGANDEYVVAVLSRQPSSRGWPAGSAVVTQAAAVLIKALGPDTTR